MTKEVCKSSSITKESPYIFTNIWVDGISYLFILFVVGGSVYMYDYMDDMLIVNAKEINRPHKFPNYEDLLPSVGFFIIMIIFHKIFKSLTLSFAEKILHPRYAEEGEEMVEIHKHKLCTYAYKFIFYLLSTIFGFYVLKGLNFFPWSLLGSGEYKDLFEGGHSNIFTFQKPEYFDLYYNLNLSFALFDGWVLISNPLQSDFLLMVLHHLSTYSLVIFSFVSNYSGIGCIVYYLHYLGDVFSYIVRVSIHMDVKEIAPFLSTLIFLLVFTYTRIFVFGDVLYQNIYGMTGPWTPLEWSLMSFLFIIMILNVLWIVLISRKFIKYCMTGNIEEIYKFKIKNKTR
jgi:hypothetical protein